MSGNSTRTSSESVTSVSQKPKNQSGGAEDRSTPGRKKRPGILSLLFPLALGIGLIAPSFSFWGYAGHLARDGQWETAVITREYRKVTTADSGDRMGRSYFTDLSVFAYGPPGARREGELLQSRGFAVGDAIEVVYDPAEPRHYIAAPRGRSQLSLYLSTNGITARALMAAFALLVCLPLVIINGIYLIRRFARGEPE